MNKKKMLKGRRGETTAERNAIRMLYDEKYFNLFLDSRERVGLTYEEAEFILRKLWSKGKIAAFKCTGSDVLGYAEFTSTGEKNMYNFPTGVTLINERGVEFIPTGVLTPHENVALGYILHSHTPLYALVSNYLERITDVEMAIRMNVKAHKIPLAIEVSEDSETDAEELNAMLESDETTFFIKSGRADLLKAVSAGAPFILDKLHAYKVSLDNELLTLLGVNNIPMEKKERLITDETESNNELIASYAAIIDSCLEDWSKEIKEVFKTEVALPRKKIITTEVKDDESDKE